MIVDRDDLQTQAGKLFLSSEEFLSLGAAKIIADRQDLKTEMSIRKSGGFFICTIQKFCEEIGELNTRKNIICFSDEAHRTQVKLNKQLKVKDKKADGKDDKGKPLGAFVTKPYAEHLRIAFPKATFVGFTGTPIEETIQVFGEVVDSYTMQQSVDDDITVGLKYIPRIANVTLNSEKAKEIDKNQNVSMHFAWLGLERQVRVEGVIEKISKTESLKYFLSRPKGSQIGAWVSHQSEVVNSRSLLEAKFDEIRKKFSKGEIPFPSFWGGYIIKPTFFEFWQGGHDRLHDRFAYSLEENSWSINRLEP